MDKKFRLDTTGGFTSQIKAARRVLKEFKKKVPKEIDMHKLRTGKTTYFFDSKRKMNAKLKELDIGDFEYAGPGNKLPNKKIL